MAFAPPFESPVPARKDSGARPFSFCGFLKPGFRSLKNLTLFQELAACCIKSFD
jgi:hypothetical protein